MENIIELLEALGLAEELGVNITFDVYKKSEEGKDILYHSSDTTDGLVRYLLTFRQGSNYDYTKRYK